MTSTQIYIAFFGLCVAFASQTIVLLRIMFGHHSKVVLIDFKVDQLWHFMMSSAKAEAVIAGAAKQNSPIVPTEKGMQLVLDHGELIEEVFHTYLAAWTQMSREEELLAVVSSVYGTRIRKEIGIPNGMHNGADIWLVIEAVRDRAKAMPIVTPVANGHPAVPPL